MADKKIGQMVFSVAEGGEVVITFPHPLTVESVAELEEFFALMFRGMRRTAVQAQAAADADAEYLSWVPVSPRGVFASREAEPDAIAFAEQAMQEQAEAMQRKAEDDEHALDNDEPGEDQR